MKRSIWKFSRLFVIFILIIGGMVGVLRAIQYLADTSNASNGVAANGVLQADASSSRVNLLAQSDQILAEVNASSSASSTVTAPTSTAAKSVAVKPVKTSTINPPKKIVPQSPQPQKTTPTPTKVTTPASNPGIFDSFISTLSNLLSVETQTSSQANSQAQASTTNATPTTTATTTSAPAITPATSSMATTTPPTPKPTPPPPTPTARNLPYTIKNFSDTSGWQGIWGAVSVADGSLDIGATTSTTGGEAFLADAGDWTNYRATVQLNWLKGQTFTLIARYHDSDNISCSFTNGGAISIKSTVNGNATLLGQGMEPNFTPTRPVTAWVQVKDDRVQCGLDSAVVQDYLYYGLTPALLTGGIALQTWDPQIGNAEIDVTKVDVEAL